MKLLTAAQLDNYSPRKDKTISIRFITQEKSPSEVMEIHSMIDTFGYLYFKAEEQLSKGELEHLDVLDTDLFDNGKTQSQRIRNVLYRNWEQNNVGYKEFKDYYKQKTEEIISHYKSKLL
jgi:hypothetical protein